MTFHFGVRPCPEIRKDLAKRCDIKMSTFALKFEAVTYKG